MCILVETDNKNYHERKNKMKTLITLLLFFTTVLLAQDKKEKLDRYLELLADNDKAMFSVAILEDGQPLYTNAVGLASIAEKIKNTPDTKFRLGSITKVFTSCIIFQLIEEGKLTLDSKLAEFYPQIANADKITIDHMLSHRSGIFSFTDDQKYFQYYTSPKSKNEILEIVNSYKPVFEPGEKYAYSNTNYVLLGYIIEDISGSSYNGEVQNRITSKLDLKNTYYGSKIDVGNDEACSYKFEDGEWQIQQETDMSIPHGAGAMVSTASDLALFIDALFKNRVVSENSLQQMKQIRDGYGKGLMQWPFYDKKAWGHNGGIDGFVSNVAYFPEEKFALAITTNGMNYNFNDILIGILSIYFDRPFDLPDFTEKDVAILGEELAKYRGLYTSKALPLNIIITQKGDQLFAQATGQNAFPLTPFSATEFRFEQAGIVIEFFSDKNNVVQYDNFILKQRGGTFSYVRKSEKED